VDGRHCRWITNEHQSVSQLPVCQEGSVQYARSTLCKPATSAADGVILNESRHENWIAGGVSRREMKTFIQSLSLTSGAILLAVVRRQSFGSVHRIPGSLRKLWVVIVPLVLAYLPLLVSGLVLR